MEWLVNKETTPHILEMQIRSALRLHDLKIQIYLTQDNKTLVGIVNSLSDEQIDTVEQTIINHQAIEIPEE